MRSRQERRKRIESVLRTDIPFSDDGKFFDFLSPDLLSQFDIYDSELAGSNLYDADALGMIERHPSGIILDCGADSRPAIYENVVNFASPTIRPPMCEVSEKFCHSKTHRTVLNRSFVKQLSAKKNLDLASSTTVIAKRV